MARTSLALALAATVIVCAQPAAAQSPRKRLSDLMIEAYDHLEAGEKLVAAKKTAQANDRLERACAAYAEVLAGLKALKVDAKLKQATRQVCHYNTACARSLQGKTDAALTAFKQALDAGYQDWSRIERDRSLDGLRKNPRFAQLLERVQAKLANRARALGGAHLSPGALFPYDFSIKTLDGKALKLADLKGKVVIVDYWGTWCPPCRMEIPHFVALQKAFGDKLVVVGMGWEHGRGDARTVKQVKAFAAQVGINYPLAVLTQQADLAAVPGGINAFPTTLFIDRQGRVRAKEIGYHDEASLKAIVKALLAEPAPKTPDAKQPKQDAPKQPKKKSRFF